MNPRGGFIHPTPLAGEPRHHLSTSPNGNKNIIMAEGMGFEPMCAYAQTDFESAPL